MRLFSFNTTGATNNVGSLEPSMNIAINGAGATFPAPLYNAWAQDYGQKRQVSINYQAIGSGGGIKAITVR